MIIVLSGPQHAYKAAQDAVASAGFKIVRNETGDPDPYNHGLFDDTETPTPTCFLTLEGDESRVNDAHDTVTALGWRLRSHFDMAVTKPLTPVEKLANLGLTPAELKQLIGV